MPQHRHSLNEIGLQSECEAQQLLHEDETCKSTENEGHCHRRGSSLTTHLISYLRATSKLVIVCFYGVSMLLLVALGFFCGRAFERYSSPVNVEDLAISKKTRISYLEH